MNPEALIGTVLGTYTLSKLIGQGEMGAVFLAHQSHLRRQVAIKVLLPTIPQVAGQHMAFLEHFRREASVVASLVHPNIMQIHDYGERDGLAYLVMPYITGDTLRVEMEQWGPLPLARVLNYLQQVAMALDFAHARGIIHRNIKPTNLLKTAEGHLLLTDFGFVKLPTARQMNRLSPVESRSTIAASDYLAPEQVIGGEIDARTDIYTLGVILYQMVTGVLPFKGSMSVPIAMQHNYASPQPPRTLRPDLPPAAEQVILRALARHPAERYPRVQDLVSAFQLAITSAEASLKNEGERPLPSNKSADRPFLATRSLFDSVQQSGMATKNGSLEEEFAAKIDLALPPLEPDTQKMDIVMKTSIPLPSLSGILPPEMASMASTTPPDQMTFMSPPTSPNQAASTTSPDQTAAMTSTMSPILTGATRQLALTGVLSGDINGQGTSNTVKLAQPVKVVQVPVAGQPGRYMTGFLPVLPPLEEPPSPFISLKDHLKKKMGVVILAAVVCLVLLSSGTFWLVSSHVGQTTQKTFVAMPGPDLKATAAFQATATAQANTILTDSLSENIHNWPLATDGPKSYVFKDNAYHIASNDAHAAIALLPDEVLPDSFIYSLDIEAIKGDENTINNQLGMILRYSTHQKNGSTVTTFYCFDVANAKTGEYQFWKYDDSNMNPWNKLWSHSFGKEYHFGHGAANKNTFKVSVKGNKFTFFINGKQVGAAQDNALTSGQIGMLVNLQGSEAAFTNLVLMYNK